MKTKRIILRDGNYSTYDDFIIFDKEVEKKDILSAIERAKRKEDYTNEDIYEELEKISPFTIFYIGDLDVFHY